MGVTRTDLFTKQQNELAYLSRALAHPARIAIVQHLARTRTCSNGAFVQELGLAQATVSQHLRELKDAELIQGNIEGVSVSYCINPKKWRQVRDMLNALFDAFESPNAPPCC